MEGGKEAWTSGGGEEHLGWRGQKWSDVFKLDGRCGVVGYMSDGEQGLDWVEPGPSK